ncbi:Pseudouridine-metabolizing bifunctional protein C1861.05-like isoform X1 [Oopsacas minuta]|uniref:Pseudouridine-metabolizing bifunctional protein C1861.05-like isoform X1 n=1 Tax=Oopsacas minuta TaxID=111878 RepID=A0AAV7JCN7_9METZ|nr:Pseudouridine-metabolizing bifunctional protein C1861.05-like isoform X1 [Oopsacas minuta]
MRLHRTLNQLRHVKKINSRHRHTLTVSTEVSEAVRKGRPIVALESAVLSHGMPPPDNFNTAVNIQNILTQMGVVPAVTAVIDGTLRVGLAREELERLCNGDSNEFVKVSRRDLAPCVAKGLTGGTTVSGSMLLAHWAGINLLVTGGIGGVHLGGENSMDVSADLIELGRTPVTVVCAGVKSILDIQRTLEVLETQGVTVCTLGEDQIPAFYSTHSGIKAPLRVDSITEITCLISANKQLELSSGIVVCVPLSKVDSINKEEIDSTLKDAMQTANDNSITGNKITPYLLDYMNNRNPRYLDANISLLKNNTIVGARIAKSLSSVSKRYLHTSTQREEVRSSGRGRGRPVVIGGINFDLVLKFKQNEIDTLTTNAGCIKHSLGGVGRNLAQCLKQLGPGCEFISVVGQDTFGQMILKEMPDPQHVRELSGVSTAKYCAMLNEEGEHMYGMGDMDIHQLITPKMIQESYQLIANSPIVAFDGNICYDTMIMLIGICKKEGVPTWFEPTCRALSAKFLGPTQLYPSIISPNREELVTIHRAMFSPSAENSSLRPDYQTATKLCTDLLRHIPVVLLTLGGEGALVGVRHKDMLHSPKLLSLLGRESTTQTVLYPVQFVTNHMPAVPVSSVTSVSGAGDCLAGTVIAGLSQGVSLEESVSSGIIAASLSLLSNDTVPDTLTDKVFSQVKDTSVQEVYS